MALKVLIVEDSQAALESLEEFLREICGFEVFTASAGEKALELLKAERPAVVLLNLYLGPEDMSGLRILREAKAGDPEIVVYVMTGFDKESIRQKALAQGADDYWLKPLDLDKIQSILLKAAGELAKKGRA